MMGAVPRAVHGRLVPQVTTNQIEAKIHHLTMVEGIGIGGGLDGEAVKHGLDHGRQRPRRDRTAGRSAAEIVRELAGHVAAPFLIELRQPLAKTASNYTPEGTKSKLVDRGVTGGEQCFSCPYSFHCEIGKEIVLAST